MASALTNVTKELAAKGFQVSRNTLIKKKLNDPSRRIEIEIGDSKQNNFFPQLKTKHWDNECNFSLRLKDSDYSSADVSTFADRIEWRNKNRIVRFYELAGFHDGGVEFEVLLLNKSAGSFVEFTIQSKGLRFFYQPPLTDAERKAGDIRPENIVGSYAVYHETKTGNSLESKSYLTGKAFHIYRPYAIDAAGKKIWCTLRIDEQTSVMTISVPHWYFKFAKFPILIDPTLGYTTAGGSSTFTSTDRIRACQYTATEGGSITSMSMWCDDSGGADNGTMIIYSDTGADYPDALLYETAEFALSNAATWNTQSLSGTFSTSDKLWLGLYTSGATAYYDITGSDPHRTADLAYDSSAPATFPGGAVDDTGKRLSVYITYSNVQNYTKNLTESIAFSAARAVDFGTPTVITYGKELTIT